MVSTGQVLLSTSYNNQGFPGGSGGKKNLPAMWEDQIPPLSWEDLLEKGMATHSSILTWKSHGQSSLTSYSLWGCKEVHMSN